MKIRGVSLLLVSMILGTGAVFYFQRGVNRPPPHEILPEIPTGAASPNSAAPAPDIRSIVPQTPEPPPTPEKIAAVPGIRQAPRRTQPAPSRQTTQARYWEQAANNFEKQWLRLNGEENPARRKQLVEIMARNVRMDTLATLDWAMSLDDPAERTAALQAINQNALSGIGARIEMDKTGFPKIRETTILSAIDSTGLVESGDYISGIVNADGSTTSFKGRSIQEIVKLLRGKPGTEVLLQMERPSNDNQPEPSSFDVSVLRSLIVITPPF
jgi:C-terminal processing protease CtpA/Prc